MSAKKSRAPPSLKLNLSADSFSNQHPARQSEPLCEQSFLSRENRYLTIDDRVMITGVKHAQDLQFLQKNQSTHVVNCVAQVFPSPHYSAFHYLDLAMNDSLDQDLMSFIG